MRVLRMGKCEHRLLLGPFHLVRYSRPDSLFRWKTTRVCWWQVRRSNIEILFSFGYINGVFLKKKILVSNSIRSRMRRRVLMCHGHFVLITMHQVPSVYNDNDNNNNHNSKKKRWDVKVFFIGPWGWREGRKKKSLLTDWNGRELQPSIADFPNAKWHNSA